MARSGKLVIAQGCAGSRGAGSDRNALATNRAVHRANYTAVPPYRRTKHQVTLAGGTGHARSGIAHHSSDLTCLGIVKGVQRSAAFDPLSPVHSTAAVEKDREGHTPPVSKRATLWQASQVRQEPLDSFVSQLGVLGYHSTLSIAGMGTSKLPTA